MDLTVDRWRTGAWRWLWIGRVGPFEWAILALIGLFLALIGAYDTDGQLFHERFVYWVACLVGGGVFMALVEIGLDGLPHLQARPFLRGAMLAFLMSFPVTVWVWTVSRLLGGRRIDPEIMLPLFPSVWVVCCGVVAITWLARPLLGARPAPAARDDTAPLLLREKLEPRLGRSRLVAVQAEDHYLRVHTRDGSALILMRFSDALAALNQSDGFQTHRSWWVARSAVERAAFRRGRGELELSGGLKAPVSRAYAAAVRGVDWG